MASALRTATATATATADNRSSMPRQPSIDSTASSLSASTIPNTASSRASIAQPALYRASSEAAGPQDVASVIASAGGSSEAAIRKLLSEKSSAASHNAQLWRLVEKQRSMIMDLNKDLEKSLKDKDRYRKKLKDHLVSSSSAPLLTGGRPSPDPSRKQSQSPALDLPARAAAHPLIRDISDESRKVSESSDGASFDHRRSDTPQDAAIMSASALPTTPQSSASLVHDLRFRNIPPSSPDIATLSSASTTTTTTTTAATTTPPPLSPRLFSDPAKTPQQAPLRSKPSTINAISPSAPGFKNNTRKAPPAPLDLSPRPAQPALSNAFAADDGSESEYEDDPDSARAEQLTRGRRKTREDDDREREVLARQEEEARSRSTKKKSSSKGKAAAHSEMTTPQAEDFPMHRTMVPDIKAAQQPDLSQPAALLRQRGIADGAGLLPRNNTAPALMSPGLPMSPRPGDRPLNAPMPRAPNKGMSSIPMSPRAGAVLSPRPPKQPIPLPPQTPLTFTSPHLARAEQYSQHAASQPSIGNLLAESSASGATSDVYRGLVTEQYPDLLLPPNALPSIIVKTASSRMRPSRQSFIAPKQTDENPVFTIGVHQRSDGRQLWRAEKTLAALAVLDHQIKVNSNFRDKLPDKTLFAGHAPAKIDARRNALDLHFERMLDSVTDEKTAKIVCKFLSTDALAAEGNENYAYINEPRNSTDASASTPVRGRTRREGYLTKRGKNFGGWKARYFVLDGPALKYFEAPGGAQLGSIKLQSAQIGKQAPAANQNNNEDEENQFRHAFLILEPKRKDSTSLVRHVLCAESDAERDLWVDALLQYVDWKDEGDVVGGGIPIVNGARSPRLQKSMGELRPSSQHDSQLRPSDALRYDQMVAGDAPLMGANRAQATPPPRNEDGEHPHPQISAPSNAQVIHNAGDWGMKSPSTPGSVPKDKKRGLFNFRGRSSSDLAPSDKPGTPGHASDNYPFPRAVFGVPLAEAVSYVHPSSVTTELPTVVYRCLEYLHEKDAASEEGIFRLSGSNTVIKGLRDRFNHEGDVNLVADDQYYDIHAVASLLKLYLRELPASILTRHLHFDFLKCLELPEKDRVVALNIMVNKLPAPNRALLASLSAFLLSIVSNAEVNKMNVRNVGIVFAPTLNVPGPLITSFVEDQEQIFGEPIDEAESPIAQTQTQASTSTDLRSPRKQMFTDLPTPAYNQTQFQSFGTMYQQQPNLNDTGMIPMQPTYQIAPQGDGGYGSLNDALRSPSMQTFNTGTNGLLVPKDAKSKRRESSMMVMSPHSTSSKKSSNLTGLGEGEEDGGRF